MESQPPEKIQAVLVYIRLAVGAARDFRSLACEGLISHCIWETSTDRRGCIWIENTTDPIKVGCTSKYTYSVCVCECDSLKPTVGWATSLTLVFCSAIAMGHTRTNGAKPPFTRLSAESLAGGEPAVAVSMDRVGLSGPVMQRTWV